MSKCINTNLDEYKELLAQSGLDSLQLSTKMGVYMENNQTDEWPSLEQLGINDIQFNLSNKDITVLPLRGNEGLYRHYKLLDSNGKVKGLSEDVAKKYAKSFNDKGSDHRMIARHTTDGKWRVFIVDDAMMNISSTNSKAEDKAIVDAFVNKVISKVPGIQSVEWIDASQLPKILGVNLPKDRIVNAFVDKGKVYLVKDRVTADIAIEELLHPLVYALSKENSKLFDKLLKEVLTKPEFKQLKQRILKDYADKSMGYINNELVTQALATVTRQEIENNPKGRTFMELAAEFFQWLATWLNKALDIAGGKVVIKAEDLYEGFSLRDLAKVLNTNDITITTTISSKDISFNKAATTAKKLQEAAADVQRSEDHVYSNTKTGKVYTPVSEAMKALGYKQIDKNADQALLARTAELGSFVHSELSTLLVGHGDGNTYNYKLSSTASAQLAKISNGIKRQSAEILSEQVLVDEERSIAGTADIISIDADGLMSVLDLKTSETGGRFKFYDNTKFQQHSNRSTDALQMSIYSSMASSTTGKAVKSIKVIKAIPIIEADGITISRFSTLEVEELLVNKDHEKVTGKVADAFLAKENKTKLERVVEDSITSLEARMAAIAKSKNLSISETESIEDTLEKLRIEQKNQAVIDIAKYSKKAIENKHAEWAAYLKEIEAGTKELTPQGLYKFREYVESYLFLDDIVSLTDSLEGSLSDKDKQTLVALDIQNTIRLRDEIIRGYTTLGTQILTKLLSTTNNYTNALYREEYEREFNYEKRNAKYPSEAARQEAKQAYIDEKMQLNKDMIAKEHQLHIEKELQQASRDINVLSRWLDNIMDSPDLVVGSAARMIAEAGFKTRQASIDKHTQMLDILKELEKSLDKGMFQSMPDFYNIFLEKDENGKPNGYLVDKFTHQLREDYKKLYENERAATEQAINKNKDAKERLLTSFKERMYEWKEKVAPLNVAEFTKAKIEYLTTLLEAKKISQKDFDYYTNNINTLSRPSNWEGVKLTGTVSKDFADYVDEFIYTNAWNFREVRPEYADKYESKQYKVLEELRASNPEDIRIKFYDLLLGMKTEADKLVPFKDRLGFRLPGIEGSPMEMYMKGSGNNSIKDWWNTVANDATLYRVDDDYRNPSIVTDAYGNERRFLPVRYTSEVDPSKQSYDLATIYFKYWQMATDYHNKLEILPTIEMMKYMVNERTATKRDSKGNPIYNASKRITNSLEKKIATTPKGERTNLAQQFNDVVAALLYGDRDVDMGSFKFMGKTFDTSKTLDSIAKYTSLNMLGLNPVVGISNVLTGETLQKIEAHFGKHVSAGSYWKANWVYEQNIAGTLSDIGSRQPSHLVGLLNQKFDVLNDGINPRYRKDTRGANLISESTLYATMQVGEHWMQSRLMMAMLNDVKAKDSNGNVLKRADGKDASMLDLYTAKDGKLVFDNMGGKVANWTTEDQFKFQQKLKAVQTQIHGQFNEMEFVAIQRHALGRMMYQFRKFIVPGVKRRFGKRYYNNRLEEFEEGSYRVWGRYINALVDEINAYRADIASEGMYKFTDKEKQLIAKTNAEIAIIATLFALTAVLGTIADDEDDKTTKDILKSSQYFTSRLRMELFMYVDWQGAYNLLRSPAASLTFVDNVFSFTKQLTDPFELYKRGNFKDESKLKHRFIDLLPMVRQIYRVQTIPERVNLVNR